MEYAHTMSLWEYEGIYSFYDHNENNINEYMDGTYFTCTDVTGKLIGYYCFGENARIPTQENYIFDNDYLDIGLGMKPDMCGKKNGLSFFQNGLNFAQEFYSKTQFRLSVAAFNKRAIKVYLKTGFYIECEVTNSYYNNKFFVMKNVCCNNFVNHPNLKSNFLISSYPILQG